MPDVLAALMTQVWTDDYDPEPWRLRAACRGMGPAGFFDLTNDALAACDRCPVTRECNDYATAHRIKYGVWGGVPRWVRLIERPSGRCAECGEPAPRTYCSDRCKQRACRKRRG